MRLMKSLNFFLMPSVFKAVEAISHKSKSLEDICDHLKGTVAIVGIGEVPSGKFPDRPCLKMQLSLVGMQF